MDRKLSVLRGVTAAALLVGLTAWVYPVSVPSTVIPPAGLDSPLAIRDRGLPDAQSAQAVIAANIFSASRRAPAARYNPFAAEPEPYAPPTETAAPAESGEEAVPRLYGTMVGPGGASAIMRLDPAVPGSQLYREGDRAGAYRVLKITPQSVTLSGPGGQIVLRLNRPEGQTP